MDNEKYSLRQRQKRKYTNIDSQGYNSDNSNESLHNILLCKKTSTGGSTKSKTKAAPLSKYRRKTANARERTRMREINSAFENLRHCVPACIANEDVGPSSEKLTKITTLRLAMKYIRVLSDALVDPKKPDYRFLFDSIACNPNSSAPEDSPCLEAEKATDPRSNAGKANVSSMKRHHRKGKSSQRYTNESSPIPNFYETSPASNSSSAYASLSSFSDSSASPTSNCSYRCEGNSLNKNCRLSMSDLSNFVLESDGESMNLSETWPSPLRGVHNVSSMSNDLFQCSASDMHTLENPLELSLRLMEPPIDSLALSPSHVSGSQSPCLTPLMNLETFNSFDLFHSDDFGEQSALDLFLT
ncbi:helix-loop-helix protein delilah taxi [Musca autumnalis]|uniref:helix-loop-helix protein delilah taxi n=1 Tax=Musca autumnalis TaxID=221902 RepID=UPI003CF78646